MSANGLDFTIGIGGAAGQGIATPGNILARIFARRGLHLYSYNAHQSIIRGGHSLLMLRVRDQEVHSHGDGMNLLLCLNQDTMNRHLGLLGPGSRVLYNSDKVELGALPDGVLPCPMPIGEMAGDSKNKLIQNTISLGVMMSLMGVDFSVLEQALELLFARKGAAMVEENVTMAKAGFDHGASNFEPYTVPFPEGDQPLAIWAGNDALAMGGAAAGVKFYAAYPMSPASGVLHWMANNARELGIMVRQVEDEIGVANMTIGAAHAGCRSMCATSGGGFALMTEAVGSAAMMEIPVVFINVMRAGPSTGVPTKTEQGRPLAGPRRQPGRLRALHRGAEGLPRRVQHCSRALRPRGPRSMPRNHHLRSAPLGRDVHRGSRPHRPPPRDRSRRPPSSVLRPTETTCATPTRRAGSRRERCRATRDTSTSWRRTSTMRTECWSVTSSPIRTSAVRWWRSALASFRGVAADVPPPTLEGPPDAEVTLVGWGTTYGVVREAIDVLAERGVVANQLAIKWIVPFHDEVVDEILSGSNRVLIVENSYSGQFARYLRRRNRLRRARPHPEVRRRTVHAAPRRRRGPRAVTGRGRPLHTAPGDHRMSTAESTAELIGLELAQSPTSAKEFKGKVAPDWCPGVRRLRSAERAPACGFRAGAQTA